MVVALLAGARLMAASEPSADVLSLKREAEGALARGEASKAVDLARQANRRMPDDLESYSLLVRAYLKLGRIGEAEREAQWMLDIRTEHPLSLVRAADVREAIGQWDGAMVLLNDAYGRARTPQEKAVILMQAAGVQRKAGRPDSAERLTGQARRLAQEESK
jgi:tetratricopeptide (TPR) repeat protein